MKKCKKCLQDKPESSYYSYNRSTCKACKIRAANLRNKAQGNIRYSRRWLARKAARLKTRARLGDIPCNINTSDIAELYVNRKKCVYCDRKGLEPVVDRKIPELGYSTGNLVLACDYCNYVKSNRLSYEEMLLVGKTLKKIYRHRLVN